MQNADDDAAEAAINGPDLDAVEGEVGDQDADLGIETQEPSYSGSILVDEAQYGNLSEADEAAALQPMALIGSDEAKAVAEAANPGSTALQAEPDNENGVLVYSVELSNGTEVKVDAGTERGSTQKQMGPIAKANSTDKRLAQAIASRHHRTQIKDEIFVPPHLATIVKRQPQPIKV